MKLIKLDGHYQNLHGVHIPPGTYDITDGELAGLGEYLVQTGHATVLGGKSAATVEADPRVEAFKKFTNQRLAEIAEDNDVDLEGASKKGEIVAALVKANVEPPEA